MLFILVIFVSFCIAPREFSGMEEPDGTGKGQMISDDGSLAPPYPPLEIEPLRLPHEARKRTGCCAGAGHGGQGEMEGKGGEGDLIFMYR